MQLIQVLLFNFAEAEQKSLETRNSDYMTISETPNIKTYKLDVDTGKRFEIFTSFFSLKLRDIFQDIKCVIKLLIFLHEIIRSFFHDILLLQNIYLYKNLFYRCP